MSSQLREIAERHEGGTSEARASNKHRYQDKKGQSVSGVADGNRLQGQLLDKELVSLNRQSENLDKPDFKNKAQEPHNRKKVLSTTLHPMGLESNKKPQRTPTTIKSKPSRTLHPDKPNMRRIRRLYTEQPSAQPEPTQSTRPAQTRHSTYIPSMPSSTLPHAPPGKGTYDKQHPPSMTKQQLYDQNIQLRGMVNELREELNRQKVQTEMERRKNKKYTAKLGREFGKDMYYYTRMESRAKAETSMDVNQANKTGNIEEAESAEGTLIPADEAKVQRLSPIRKAPILASSSLNPRLATSTSSYMVAGIRQKYEELRQEHEATIAELTQLKQTNSLQKLQEVSVYCQVLEESNRKLANALQVAKGKLMAYQKQGDDESKQEIKDKIAYLSAQISQMSDNFNNVKAKNTTLKDSNRKLKAQLKQKDKKIAYLQSIILSKSNLLHQTQKKSRQIIAQLKDTTAQHQTHIKHTNILRQQIQQQKQKLIYAYTNQISQQSTRYQQQIDAKNQIIRRQEKQISYFNTIIKHWKPKGDDPQHQHEQAYTSKKAAPHSRRGDRSDKEEEQRVKEYQQQMHTNRQALNKQIEMKTISTGREKKLHTGRDERTRQTSGVKSSEHARKMRKVAFEQIAELPEYLRYRLIGHNITLEQLGKYFDSKDENDLSNIRVSLQSIQSQPEEPPEIKWSRKYITHAEVLQILSQAPFSLKPDDALLLTRYIIQDQLCYEHDQPNNAFAYCDQHNQIERTIVKSIIKAFIQTQSSYLPQDKALWQQCEQEWQTVYDKNGGRLSTALGSIAPNGCISRERWNDLLKGINIGLGEQVREWCIGRMLVESEGLARLKYRVIAKEVQ